MDLIEKIELLKKTGKIQKFSLYTEIIDISAHKSGENIFKYFDLLIDHLQEYLVYDSKPSLEIKTSIAQSFSWLFYYIQNNNDQQNYQKYFPIFHKFAFLIEDFVELAKIYQCFGYFTWLDHDIDASKNYLQKSLELINQTEMNILPSRYTNLGFIYESTGDYKIAEDYYLQGLKFAQKRHYQEAMYMAYNALGRLNFHLEIYEKAQNFFQAAIDLHNQDSLHPKDVPTLMNLASTHVFLKQYNQAKECLDAVHQDWLKNEDTDLYYSSMANTVILYNNMGENKKAKRINEIVLEFAKKNNNDELLFACYYNQGNMQLEFNKPESAILSAKKALEIARKANNPKQESFSLKILANGYMDCHDYDSAIKVFSQAEKILSKFNDESGLSSLLKNKADCFYSTKNYKKACDDLKKHLKITQKMQKKKDEKDLLLKKQQSVKSGNVTHLIFKDGYTLISKELNAKIGTPIIGQSNQIQKVVQQALLIASSNNASVLLRGESGTGKELIARLIHFSSDRSTSPFVPVNSASFTTNLAQSTLFGHEKGAFTGAIKQHHGFFEQAHSGTIFLDEIVEMPLDIQANLLRVLEEKSVRRLGCDKLVNIDFRLISATNSDINQMVQDKLFRLDLLNRINTLEIVIPPLRERLDDIPLFIDYFSQKISNRLNRKKPEMEAAVISSLLSYNYPGNVREFVNIMEKLIIFCKNNYISEEDLSFLNLNNNAIKLDNSVQNFNLKDNEQMLINTAMIKCNNCQMKAAKLLGIPNYTLSRKLKKLNS